MILLDVNVLIYAYRADAERHGEYKAWLESVINGSAAYGVAPQVLSSVVHVCTHPRIFARPSSSRQAFEFCRVLLEQPNATRHHAGRTALVDLRGAVRPVAGDRQSGAGRVVRRARYRGGMRMDHDGSRLRPLP